MRRIRSARVLVMAAALVGGAVTATPANAAPIYPMIAVQITARAGQVPTYSVVAQAPTPWSCAQGPWGSGVFVVTCTAPAAPVGFENTCLWTVVNVTSAGIPGAGNLYGQTQCDNHPGSAASTPSGGSASDVDAVNVQFSTVVCRAQGGVFEPSTRPWTVSCTNNH